MGRLEGRENTDGWLLPERCLLGRSHTCAIRLCDPRVSAEHALLRWNGRAWELQDLGSRNGTFVTRRCLAVGERAILGAGEVVGFGSPDGFRLTAADPPAPFAAPVSGGSPIEAIGGLLVLPDVQRPELTIHHTRDHGWAIEREGQVMAVANGDIVETSVGLWRLSLPESLQPTEEADDGKLSIDNLTLLFRVSTDEENVELLAFQGKTMLDLKVRTHHYPLLLLARARLQDADSPPERQGWVRQSELCRQLRCESDKLYIDIFRMRRQLADAGVADAGKIVERHSGAGLIRVGVSRIEIGSL